MTAPRQFCSRLRWRVIPFMVVFLITIAVLLGVYRFRMVNKADEHNLNQRMQKSHGRSRGRNSKNNLDEVRTNDRWLVVSDDQDLEFVCTLINVTAELEWRTLVVGNNITCCSSRRSCVLLDDVKVGTLRFSIQSQILNNGTASRRNIAYLFAMQHGARHIFDAYPETYVAAGIDVDTFRKEMSHQLQKLALNVALGLVSERPYVKRVHNPYAHFGRPDLWTEGFRRNNQRHVHQHGYRICEVRPPSIEKFLETDDGFFDRSAPALTLPGTIVAPFPSKNVLYSIEAFWGLILLPKSESQTMSPHLFRTLWNQAVLGDIAGSMKLSLSNVATLQRREKGQKNPSELREPDGLATFLLKWGCSTRSSLACIRDLTHSMFQFQYTTAKSLSIVESWISDLQKLRYLEPPIIPRRRGYMNPCLGADGLNGVSFYPALSPKQVTLEQLRRRNATLERYQKEEALLDSLNRAHGESLTRKIETELTETRPDEAESAAVGSRNGKLVELGEPESAPLSLVREFTESACPGYSQLLPHKPADPMHNVLLIVAMTTLRYDLIPAFEVVYREQFPNILYCGAPHDSIGIYLRKYQHAEDRSFSFLPIHTKYTYECVMGALEMGYNVDGYLMTTDDALINNWNIPQLNISQLWYSGDYNIQVSAREWKTLDPGGQKLPRSLEGVLKVLEFLKSSLIGSAEDRSAYHEYKTNHTGRLSKREAELSHSAAENAPVPFLISADDPAEAPTRLPIKKFTEVAREDELVVVKTTPQNVLSDTLKQPLNKVGLVFDVLGLKSIDDEQNDHPDVHSLPALKSDVATDDNATDFVDGAQQEIEIVESAVSPLPDGKQLADTSQEMSATSESDEEESASPSESLEDESEEDESEEDDVKETDVNKPKRPVPEVLHELLVATRNTNQTTTSTTPESALVEAGSSTSETSATSPMTAAGAAIPEGEHPPAEKSANISHVADVIFHLDDEWAGSSNSSDGPSVDSIVPPSDDPKEAEEVAPKETDLTHIAVDQGSDNSTFVLDTPVEGEREPPVEEPEGVLSVEEPEYQLVGLQSNAEVARKDDVSVKSLPPNDLGDTLQLPLNKDGLVFDLVELKSFDDEQYNHPDVHSLPALKYDVATDDNATDIVDGAQQEIEIVESAVSPLPDGKQLADASQEMSATSENDEEESASPSESLEDESEEDGEDETDFVKPERPVPEVLRELLLATRNTTQTTTSTTPEPALAEIGSNVTDPSATIPLSEADPVNPEEEHPLFEKSANISHVADVIFHLDDEWLDSANSSEAPAVGSILTPYDESDETKEVKEAALEDATRQETNPEETAPKETASEEFTPKKTASEEFTPEETAPEETAPKEFAAEETASVESAPEEKSGPEGTAPSPVAADQEHRNATFVSDTPDGVEGGLSFEEPGLLILEEPEFEPISLANPEVVHEDEVVVRKIAQKVLSENLKQPPSKDDHIFDLVELKSISDQQNGHPDVHSLPALKYDVATDDNATDIVDGAQQEIEIVESAVSPLPDGKQVADASKETNVTSAIPVEDHPVSEKSANISHVADAIFHLDDEWTGSTNSSDAPSVDSIVPPSDEPKEAEEVAPKEVSVDQGPDNSTFVSDTAVEAERKPVEEPEGVLTVEEPEQQSIGLPSNATEVDEPATSAAVEPVVEEAKATAEEKPSPVSDDERRAENPVEDLLSTLQDIYKMIQENLGVPTDPGAPSVDVSFYGADRTPYRLNPKSIHHFRCEKGTKLEFCKVSSEFLYHLSENNGKELRLVYDKVPLYFIPKSDQLKFYLLSNLMHQHGVTDEIAIPLMLTGLSSEYDWVKLRKSHFGGHRNGGSEAANKYPLFDSSAAVLYPADFNALKTDSKMNKVFCLKYLLRILQS